MPHRVAQLPIHRTGLPAGPVFALIPRPFSDRLAPENVRAEAGYDG
jgi:hypothetical protein